MSTSGTERFCKLCLMLMEVGTKASLLLLLKRVDDLCPDEHKSKWTIDDFLKSKEHILKKIPKNQYKALLPGNEKVDLTKWDLSRNCFVLKHLCELESNLCSDVDRLHSMRNNLSHKTHPTVEEDEYQSLLEDLKVSTARMVRSTGNIEREEEFTQMMDRIDQGTLSLDTTIQKMHSFYLMETFIREKLENVENVSEQILERVQQLDSLFSQFSERLEQIDKKLNILYSRYSVERNEASKAADLEVECFIELTNLSEKSKAKITSELVKIFEEVRSELDDSEPTKPPDTYVNLRQEVREIHELFLSKGWRITRVREKCIVLYIRSTSFASLASLFRECNKGEISAHLDGMRKELSSMEGAENVKVEFFIYKDEFLNVIDKTISTAKEYLYGAPLVSQLLGDNEKTDKLAITARQTKETVNRSVQVEDKKEDITTCLKGLETEIGIVFNEPQVCIKASNIDELDLQELPTTPSQEHTIQIPETGMVEVPSLESSRNKTELQTVALLEMYRAQRVVAHFLELAILYLPEKEQRANKVYKAAVLAYNLHKKLIRSKLYERLRWINYFVDVPSSTSLNLILKKLKYIKEDLESHQKNYTELQNTIKEIIDECQNAKKTEHQISQEGNTLDGQSTQFVSFAEEERTRAMDQMVKLQTKITQDPNITPDEMKDPDTRSDLTQEIDEIEILSMLRPGIALTGGISVSYWQMKSLGNIFKMFRPASTYDQFRALAEKYITTENEKQNSSGRRPLVLLKMYQQRQEALGRFEAIQNLGEFCGEECLKEVHTQLKYLDVQLARQIDIFSEMISAIHMFIAKPTLFFVDPEYYTRIHEEWSLVAKMYSDCRTESKSQISDLYSFVSTKEKTTSVKVARKWKIREIKEEISKTYPSTIQG